MEDVHASRQSEARVEESCLARRPAGEKCLGAPEVHAIVGRARSSMPTLTYTIERIFFMYRTHSQYGVIIVMLRYRM